jgi:hypothetical protein
MEQPDPIRSAWVTLCVGKTRTHRPGERSRKVITAVGHELLGFIWAIGVKVEGEQRKALGQAAQAKYSRER